MGVLSSQLPAMARLSNRFLSQVLFEEEFLIFVTLLEDDYQEAAVYFEADRKKLDQLQFQADRNMDGDFLDSGESISYRWNPLTSRIDRKSGNGYFQAFLERIDHFKWERVQNDPICHQMSIKTPIDQRERQVLFCR